MKNLFITASLLFAFSGAFAQEKGHKNVKQVKAPSSITNPTGSEVESYKTVNGNVKPIKGSSTSTISAGEVEIQPGTIVSFCSKGRLKELEKWTNQVGATELQEIVL